MGLQPPIAAEAPTIATPFLKLCINCLINLIANDSRYKKFRYKKAPAIADAFLVELVENCLHLYEAELMRWQPIIGEHYYQYAAEKRRNSLAYKP